MKLKFKYKINSEKADKLIEMYYEGLTSVDEEKELHDFLMQSDLPSKYKPEQAIFGYFEKQKNKKSFQFPIYLRWTAAVAILFIGAFSFQVFTSNNMQNYAYINGEKISDIKIIKSQALASLSEMTSTKDELDKSFKDLNYNDIIDQQLDIFSEIK